MPKALLPSPAVQRYRGPNHILVSRRSSKAAVRARLRKLIESGKWSEVHLHGLGAALAPTVALAADVVRQSNGQVQAHARTSTEALIDPPSEQIEHDDDDGRGTMRHNSAIHVTLRIL